MNLRIILHRDRQIILKRLWEIYLIASFSVSAAIFSVFALKEPPSYVGEIPRESVRNFKDHSFRADLHLDSGFFFQVTTDSRDSVSTLRLFENGRPLGPAHRAHRDVMAGGGAYTHRAGSDGDLHAVFFSSSDGLSPRENHVYSYRISAVPNSNLLWVAIALLVSAMPAALKRAGRKHILRYLLYGCFRLSAKDAAFLAITSCISGLVLLGSLTRPLDGLCGDDRQNVSIGLHLSHFGIYSDRIEEKAGAVYFRREPLYPFLIAAYDLTRNLVGFGHIQMACVDTCKFQDEGPCGDNLAQLKVIGVASLLVAAAAVYCIVVWFSGSRLLAGLGWLLTAFSRTLTDYSDSHLTEVHAAALMTSVGMLCVLAFRRKKIWMFGAAGFLLGALSLTKVIFGPLVVLLTPLLLLQGKLRRWSWKFSLLAAVAFVVSNLLVVASWMSRNYFMGGEFAIVQKRSFSVLSVRNSYNSMNSSEYQAGFLYYTPVFGKDYLKNLGFSEESFSRFDTRNPVGFRKTGQETYRLLVRDLMRKKYSNGSLEFQRKEKSVLDPDIAQALTEQAKDKILSDPIKHLQVGILLAYRGVFVEDGLGLDPERQEVRMWPRAFPWTQSLGYYFNPIEQTIFNIIAAAALILVPLLWLAKYRNLFAMICFFPALYNHAIYALTSHFIPRYAIPEIPLRAAALSLLLFLLADLVANTIIARHVGEASKRNYGAG